MVFEDGLIVARAQKKFVLFFAEIFRIGVTGIIGPIRVNSVGLCTRTTFIYHAMIDFSTTCNSRHVDISLLDALPNVRLISFLIIFY